VFHQQWSSSLSLSSLRYLLMERHTKKRKKLWLECCSLENHQVDVWKAASSYQGGSSRGPLRKNKPDSRFSPYLNKVTKTFISRTVVENMGIAEGPQTLMVWSLNNDHNEVFHGIVGFIEEVILIVPFLPISYYC
ncbi:hypothetical protein EJB05_34746, partial [Eragrostis curvula]